MNVSASEPSPRIASIKWGRIELDDGSTYKDAKLFPGGSRQWDWNETGTHHKPGIQPADVQELLDHGAQVVILSRGYLKRLGVCDETLELLKRKGVDVHVDTTGDAAELYNERAASEPVGGLFHSTC